ncbi:hypothetical protein CPC08DRAFT_788467 [Agrocybe pediades]|nr:hypothetical protein CPC08DRAFT_788467 [Agrocybe pediades]
MPTSTIDAPAVLGVELISWTTQHVFRGCQLGIPQWAVGGGHQPLVVLPAAYIGLVVGIVVVDALPVAVLGSLRGTYEPPIHPLHPFLHSSLHRGRGRGRREPLRERLCRFPSTPMLTCCGSVWVDGEMQTVLVASAECLKQDFIHLSVLSIAVAVQWSGALDNGSNYEALSRPDRHKRVSIVVASRENDAATEAPLYQHRSPSLSRHLDDEDEDEEQKKQAGFLHIPSPASYVAGLDRGASGFTTSSDIGPARDGPKAQARRSEEVEPVRDPDNEHSLFAGTTYEQDGEEADKIYEAVGEAIESQMRARRPVGGDGRGVESIPEVENLTRKRRRREERSYVVPDSVLVDDRSKTEFENALDERQQLRFPGQLLRLIPGQGRLTNFVEIGQARDKILSLKLDQIFGTQSTLNWTSTSVDPKGYLTSLDSVAIKSSAEIGDIKRAMMLFDLLVKSNPKYVPGWIAAAKHAGKMVAARKIIHCPKSEDVWLPLVEAARLYSSNTHQRRTAVSTSNHSPQTPISSLPAPSKSSHSPSSFGLPSPDSNLQTRHCRLFVQEAFPSFKSVEQRNKELAIVYKTSGGAVGDIRRHQVLLTRGQWLNKAERCDRRLGWVWKRRIDWIRGSAMRRLLREKDGSRRSGVREDARDKGIVGHRPQTHPRGRALTSLFWSMAAMETWLDGDVPAARPVLERAFAVNLESERPGERLDGIPRLRKPTKPNLDSTRKSPYWPRTVPQTRQIYEAASNISAARSSFATGIKASKPTYLMNIGVHLEGELSG